MTQTHLLPLRVGIPVTERLSRVGWVVLDGFWWVAAMLLLAGVPHHDPAHLALLPQLAVLGASAAVLHVVVGCLIGAYLTRHERGSFDELSTLVQTVAITGLTAEIVVLVVAGDTITPWLALAASALALCAMLGTRFASRSVREHRASARSTGATTIVMGAGTGGRHLVENMLADDRGFYRPVAFLDDDPAKRRLRVHGIPVLGDRQLLSTVAYSTKATHVVVAIPSIDSAALREMRDLATAAGLRLLVLPRVEELLGHRPELRDLRDIDLADLLGRRPVQLDRVPSPTRSPARWCWSPAPGGRSAPSCVSRSHGSPPPSCYAGPRRVGPTRRAARTHGRGLLEGDDLLLVDIRDPAASRRLRDPPPRSRLPCSGPQAPDSAGEAPARGVEDERRGHPQRADSREATGVGLLVNISTDKAADPTCVLGHSKRTAERLTADFSHRGRGRFVSARFGNVLGSRGSVIPAFTEQIRRGGPVTVTHPESSATSC